MYGYRNQSLLNVVIFVMITFVVADDLSLIKLPDKIFYTTLCHIVSVASAYSSVADYVFLQP